RLTADGVTFASQRADEGTEFVRSSDNWFRPVNFVNAPDGTLYVLDMSREILETIHVPLDVTKFIDFRAGRETGRIYRLAPPGFQYPGPPRLGMASTEELVQQLQSVHGWYRDTAHRLLYERQDPAAVAPLRTLLRASTDPRARVHALWSLAGLAALRPQELQAALADADPRVREQAIALAEPWLDSSPELLATIVDQASSSDARIRLQVAFTLGEVDDALAAHTLLKLAEQYGNDPWMRAAILSSSSRLAGTMLSEFLQPASLRAAAEDIELPRQWIQLIGASNDAEEVAAALGLLADLPQKHAELGDDLLHQLGRALRANGSRFAEELQRPAAADFLKGKRRQALAEAHDESLPDGRRQQAIDLLSCWPFAMVGPTLTSLLDSDHPEATQGAAIDALASYRDIAIAELLVERWPGWTPQPRGQALAAMLSRSDWVPVLLHAVRDGKIQAASLGPLEQEQLRRHRDTTIASLASEVFASGPHTERAQIVERYTAALSLPGDEGRGAQIFQQQCAACHRIGGQGHAVGPDLTTASTRDARAVLTHVLEPNRYVLPTFEKYIVLDSNGRTHTGMIAAQTANSVTLKNSESKVETILRNNIEEMVSSGISLMPEGFEQAISPEDMAHLLAFLVSLPSQPAADNPPPLDVGTLPGLVEPEN
ncbi:MAG: c-type cytochrome, partial [Planctomycetales bacterium]|nr:c-type cytochrome [Planctomycetales bacterium]